MIGLREAFAPWVARAEQAKTQRPLLVTSSAERGWEYRCRTCGRVDWGYLWQDDAMNAGTYHYRTDHSPTTPTANAARKDSA